MTGPSFFLCPKNGEGSGDAMSLTQPQRLVNSRSKRTEKDDFYRTPADGTEALLRADRDWPGPIHEPACGDGAISRVLIDRGHTVVSTDLVDRGYDQMSRTMDFLVSREALGRSLITNPPYKYATEFARHAFRLRYRKVALLCRTQFLNGKARGGLFRVNPPTVIYVFTWRLNFARSDYVGTPKPMGDHVWMVWDIYSPWAETTTKWLYPEPALQKVML